MFSLHLHVSLIDIIKWSCARYESVGKIHVCIAYKTYAAEKINGSTSFAIDNMYYVSFKIWEQECIPWCGEIQNRRSEVLGKTFNLHSNSTYESSISV